MIPLRYNLRNLIVRWRTTLLTAVGFTLVVALLIVMLAFIKGLNALSQNAGRPGNVIIMRDGATDELFSEINLDEAFFKTYELFYQYRDLTLLENDRPIFSAEVYSIATQELPPQSAGGRPRYRFLQIRGVEDAEVSAAVHDLRLKAGRWPQRTGNECIMGEGIARTLGLQLNDTFEPRPALKWTVVGILDSGGSPFNSETWAKREEVGRYFGKDNEERKQSFLTTIVVPTPNYETAQFLSRELRNLRELKLNAIPERDYYAQLSKSNQMFLGAGIFIAIVMAVGGMFGLMNTMFAAVSQRIKDIAVLRVLGYSKRQILLSFLLESLLIAAVGGLLGIILGSLVHGIEQTGQINSGMGGGKTVVFKMIVDGQVIMTAVMFTLVMGVLGGLIPAWSAMRLKLLEALR